MDNRIFLKGILYVALGAASYGMLATFVKLAYQDGFTTAEVTVSQFVYGLIGLLLLRMLVRGREQQAVVPGPRSVLTLLVAGTSMGCTSLFYYLAVKYIPVSVAIVLLMQSVWMGVVLEALIERKMPSPGRWLAVLIVLTGTVLAANLVSQTSMPDGRGVVWGLLAACSFTTTLFTANRVAPQVSAARRSLLMLCGGAVIVFTAAFFTQDRPFDFGIFAGYGLVLALFGTVLPPLLFNAGFPKTGIGPGSIVASLELPVSVGMAWLLLGEKISVQQWLGTGLILGAIVLLNLPAKRRFPKS